MISDIGGDPNDPFTSIGYGNFETIYNALLGFELSSNNEYTQAGIDQHLQSKVSGQHLDGSIAEFVRGSLPGSEAILLPGIPSYGSTVGWIDAHSASLNVIVKYLEDDYDQNGASAVSFAAIANELFDSLFTKDIAIAAGVPAENVDGTSEAQDKMRDMIAYSALDYVLPEPGDPLTGTLVFGNTGIRAMFNDANELGAVVTLGGLSSALDDSLTGIAQSIAQFAGQMAYQKVEYDNHTSLFPEEGLAKFLRPAFRLNPIDHVQGPSN